MVSALQAKFMTLVDDEHVTGESVTILFFNDDQSIRARVNLTHAVLDQNKGTVKADDLATLQSTRIIATGHGLNYLLDKSEGFLSGPVFTLIQAPNETTMNSSQTSSRAAGILGASLLVLPVSATQPPLPSAEDRAAITADAQSKAPAHAEEITNTKATLRKDLSASAATTATVKEFIEHADLPEGSAHPTPPPPEAKPLEVKPGPKDTVVNCDGGMYFDADNGVFVYLKNVRVSDPRFDLSGANEVKVFLTKKPVAPDNQGASPGKDSKVPDADSTDDSKNAKKLGLSDKFGDVDRIVATGAVRVLQKQVEPGKQPVEASGAILTFHPQDGNITITGGYPWVRQGASFMRAKQPNLILRIQQSGAFVTEGNWEMGGKIDEVKKHNK